MKLRELMSSAAQSCRPEATLAEVAGALASGNIGSLIVERNGLTVGIITERDLVGAIAAGVDPESARAAEWMTRHPDAFSPEVELVEAAEWLLETGYRHLPVQVGDRTVGMLSIRDVLGALLRGSATRTV